VSVPGSVEKEPLKYSGENPEELKSEEIGLAGIGSGSTSNKCME
jgi:hypothetical protein